MGTTADGQWVVTRCGFLQPSATARLVHPDSATATLKCVRHGLGVLQLSDGTTYYWKATDQRRGERGFFTTCGELVFRVMPRSHWMHLEAELSIAPGQERCRDLSLLVILGWYYLVVDYDDDMESAAAACAAVM
jgi:hypothetical protein